MNRRGFLAALAGLPFVGRLVPQPDTPHVFPMMKEAERRIGQPARGHMSTLRVRKTDHEPRGWEIWEYVCPFCELIHAGSTVQTGKVWFPGHEVEARWLAEPCLVRNAVPTGLQQQQDLKRIVLTCLRCRSKVTIWYPPGTIRRGILKTGLHVCQDCKEK